MTMRPNYMPNTELPGGHQSPGCPLPRTAVGSGVVDLRSGDGAGRRREDKQTGPALKGKIRT